MERRRTQSEPLAVEWYKDNYFWRKKSTDGADGKGDLIFNTCLKIYQDKDKSEWAYDALDACYLLLWDRKRWPNRMNDDSDADSWFERIFHRWINKIVGKQLLPFRYQNRMTRDPFIAFYHLAVYLNVPEVIEALSMPLYIYSAKTWRWRKRLIKDTREGFVIQLDYLRSNAVVINYEAKGS